MNQQARTTKPRTMEAEVGDLPGTANPQLLQIITGMLSNSSAEGGLGGLSVPGSWPASDAMNS
jgi:hypothetical protein